MNQLEKIRDSMPERVPLTVDSFLSVPGHLYEEDGRVLQKVFAGMNRVLDVGSHHSRAAVAIAAVANSVVTIDNYLGDAQINGPDYQSTRNNIYKYGGDKIIQIKSCWKKALTSRLVNLPMFCGVFYDAAHTKADLYEHDFLELCLFHPSLTIALHDYKPGEKGMEDCVAAINWFEEETGRKRHGPVAGSSVVWFPGIKE